MKDRFQVVPSHHWANINTKQTVSPYSAAPWFSKKEKEEWELIHDGWTIYDSHFNSYGMGRAPWKTKAEAEAVAEKWNNR